MPKAAVFAGAVILIVEVKTRLPVVFIAFFPVFCRQIRLQGHALSSCARGLQRKLRAKNKVGFK